MEKNLMVFRLVDESPEISQEKIKNPKFKLIEESPEINENIPSQAEKVAKGFKFFGYQPKAETIEKIRHPLGVGSKGLAEGLLGSHGELINFAQRISGIENPIKALPTGEDIGNFFEKLSGEEFEPKNVSEEYIKRGSQFLGSILGLSGPLKAASILKTIARTLLGAFAPAGVSLFTEKAKVPPWAQAASTIGTSFLTHRLTGKGLKDIERGLYNEAKNLAGENSVSAKNLTNNITELTKKLKKGGIEASDKEALRKITDIKNSIKNGKISIDEAMALKRKINEARGQLFAKDLGKVGIKSARRNLNNVSNALDKTIGEFDNPEFQKIYKQANQLHGGINESNKIFNFLKSNPQISGLSTVALKYFFPAFLKPGAIGGSVYQMGQFMKALAKYPGYRKAYWEVLKNASKEEIKGTTTALKNFNKKTEKLEKEGNFKLISQ